MKSQTEKNFTLDALLFVALITCAMSGILMWLGNPEKGLLYLGSAMTFWHTLHLCSGLVSLMGMVMHIASHRKWLKAMQKRSMSDLPKKLRANRIVNRVMWFIYITGTLFGLVSWSLQPFNKIGFLQAANRIHTILGFAWLILSIVHLVFHRKWIAYALRELLGKRKSALHTAPTEGLILK